MNWQKILAQGFSCSSALLDYLGLPPALTSSLAEQQFKTRVPLGFASRMQKGDALDPLLMQVLATGQELFVKQGFTLNPLDEQAKNPLSGLLHKYHGRVLLTVTGVCAVNCRYCFRRHFPYQQNKLGPSNWQPVLDYIQQDSSIHEVIFSGGDPLLLSNKVLEKWFDALLGISHIKTIRFHSRMPVVLPERIDNGLLTLLKALPIRKVMVIHCNHAQEIDQSVLDACSHLRQVNCHLLNQTVLLKGVNDKPNTLVDLSEKLFDAGVLPYYLHVLDKVAGAAHFDLPETQALLLHDALKKQLPGYLVPRLVREKPDANSKCWLC